MKKPHDLWLFVFGIALLAITAAVFAAASSGLRSARLSWGAVTQYTDGTLITAPVVYVVRRGPTALTETASLSVLLENQPLGNQCYTVAAKVGVTESEPSAPGCKIMRLATPTEGSIEAPTDGSIER